MAGKASGPHAITAATTARPSVPVDVVEPASEEWRSVVGYERRYAVSSLGRVRRVETGRIMTAKASPRQYARVNLYDESAAPRTEYVHRLVAAAFLGEPQPGQEVNHRDGDRSNSRVANLEYLTHAENTQHAHDHGLIQPARGRRNGRTKIGAEGVREIRRHALASPSELRRLARKHKISERHATHIAKGQRWQHLPYLPGEVRR